MKSWEPSIPKDLLELFHPSLELDTTKILLESETRMVNNRMLHVIKATPKEEDEEFIITDEEITPSRDVEKIEAPKEEKPEIPLQITIVSEENMSEIQKTERSVMIKKDSKFLKNKELKLGDILIFNYKESSEKDSKNEEDIILETKELMQPASIFKITDFSQTDNRFEYKTKEIPIKNISELITNAGKTIPSDMSTSELLLNPNKSLSTNITEPTDLFVYTVINERLLIITKDIEDIETVLTAYKANNQ
jgi:hypothetical protein